MATVSAPPHTGGQQAQVLGPFAVVFWLQYCVTIHWPTSWLATRGYTSFTLGFETVQEAAQWHALVQRQLSALRVRAVSSKGDSSVGHSSKPSYDEGLGLRSAGSGNGAVGRKTSQVNGDEGNSRSLIFSNIIHLCHPAWCLS